MTGRFKACNYKDIAVTQAAGLPDQRPFLQSKFELSGAIPKTICTILYHLII